MDYRQMVGFVTGKPSRHPFPEHMKDIRRIAADGMVLLKNDNNALPLTDSRVALFGGGAVETVFCGTGSGFVFAPYTVTVEQGLEDAGFELTSRSWLDRFRAESERANKEDKTLSRISRIWSGLSIMIDDLPVTDAEIAVAASADTAIYVIRRNAGEGGDRKAEKGDYDLTDVERDNLTRIAAAFRHVVVVLNTCVIDASFIDEIPGIDAAIMMSLPGAEGGNALVDVLCGEMSPNGRLSDTWARKYEDNPASATFSENDGDSLQEDYTEDIYVGYRYFDSFGIDPLYPFGYGLSYTTFSTKVTDIKADWKNVTLTAEVTNTGDVNAREVVQVYVSAPEAGLSKPWQELRGYKKTGLLAPGKSQVVTITIPTESLASYDTEKAAWVLEAGDYLFRVGSHSRCTCVGAVLTLDETAVVRQVSNKLSPDHELDLLVPPARSEAEAKADLGHWPLPSSEVPAEALRCALSAADCETIENVCDTPKEDLASVDGKHFRNTTPYPEDGDCAANPNATLIDVAEGRVRMEAFVNSLDPQVLLRLITGNANETKYSVPSRFAQTQSALPAAVQKVLSNIPGADRLPLPAIGGYRPVDGPSSSGATTSLFVSSLGIPNWLVTDGPAGLHLPLCGATDNPVGLALAQTWDDDALRTVGEIIGRELKYYNYSIILGPGMNIHRDPLCGRNFEYFAEDPLLSGHCAAEITIGVQKTPGAGVSIKHFACNDQEENRTLMNATVSERALREIHLRGFEYCVREADPKTIMTSYNKLNGVQTSSSYELLTEVVRGEWGFKGLFMTDWGTASVKAYDYAAGNDLIMGGYRSDFLTAALEAKAPEFEPDGFVKTESFKVFGGFFTEVVEYWNVFVPDAEGTDTVETFVAPGVTINAKVTEYVEAGKACVEDLPDGRKKITYKGLDRGQYLFMDDVKRCAARVLWQLIDSVSYRVMTKKEPVVKRG